MEILGFKWPTSDTGVFICQKNNNIVIVIVYANNALFLGKDKILVSKLKADFIKH